MPDQPSPYLLPGSASVPADVSSAVRRDHERFAVEGLPGDLEEYLAGRYGLDVSAEYGGFPLKNPWGKGSGQLSMTARQVAEDVEAGLGFVVLKTLIAQDDEGGQTMTDWAVRESRMLVEPIVGRSGERGWTVSWKGRGWWGAFDDYLQLVRDAQRIARGRRTLIVPSCKYHLPGPAETDWNEAEYRHTTRRLLDAWREEPDTDTPMPLEKDFSPTLAGSERSGGRETILDWLRHAVGLIRWSGAPRSVRVGLKIFNALFDEEFQLEMLRRIHEPGPRRPDFFVYANRLFDPQREFDGHRGIAYGGPDLSDRNLRVMSRFQRPGEGTESVPSPLSWSATGNITTGKTALEYALRGASSFQLHTFFQLPRDRYSMRAGSKTQKALHELYFHPETGFVVWMHDLARRLDLPTDPIRFRDVVGQGRALER